MFHFGNQYLNNTLCFWYGGNQEHQSQPTTTLPDKCNTQAYPCTNCSGDKLTEVQPTDTQQCLMPQYVADGSKPVICLMGTDRLEYHAS